jgi:hypothetical protein
MCGPNVLEVEGPVIIMEQVPMVGVGLVGSIMLKTSVALNLCEKCSHLFQLEHWTDLLGR